MITLQNLVPSQFCLSYELTRYIPSRKYRDDAHHLSPRRKEVCAEAPRNLKRRVKRRVKLARSRILRDDGTQTYREESAVVIGAQKRKAIPVAYVSDSSSGTKTLNIEERLVTWRSYFFPLEKTRYREIYSSPIPPDGITPRHFRSQIWNFQSSFALEVILAVFLRKKYIYICSRASFSHLVLLWDIYRAN